MSAVARAVLDGTLPAQPVALSSVLEAHLARLQHAVAAMPLHTQRELDQLLALLAMPVGRLALANLGTPWSDASVSQLHTALQSMRESSLMLRRQAYAALHDLTHAAYFADPATWPQLGYPGPHALA